MTRDAEVLRCFVPRKWDGGQHPGAQESSVALRKGSSCNAGLSCSYDKIYGINIHYVLSIPPEKELRWATVLNYPAASATHSLSGLLFAAFSVHSRRTG
jgi:hypothetical protein